MRTAARLSLIVLAWGALALPGVPAAQECTTRYFAPADFTQSRPLPRPPVEFARLLDRANAGDALAQRSLAASYEGGFLVDKCPAKALAWYRKAATAGEPVAQQWLARYSMFERIRRGPSCGGSGCPFFQAGEGPQVIELFADAGGAFKVPVTIGGVTIMGIVDTGATYVSMGARQAREMGINYSQGRRVMMQTANGVKESMVITLESVRVGGIVLNEVRGAVSEVEMPLLLGMSFLGRITVALNDGRMTLSRPGQQVRASLPTEDPDSAPAPR